MFPSMFFLFFALPNAEGEGAANLLLGSFSAYAFLGVIFFQFGVDLANEKENPWYEFQQSLPIQSYQLFFGRVLATLLFALLAELVLIFVVLLTTEAKLDILTITKLSLSLCIASLPFAFLARSIGILFKAKAALPVTNIFYLSMAFLGGMWIPPMALPESIQKISQYMPTRYYSEIAWHFTSESNLTRNMLFGLGAWLVGAALLSQFLFYIKSGKTRL